MSEYIGSRISLISKSDIKYVGTLHEINSETSTIALENVTSYGTEGRAGNPAQEQPGSDQIYEYIVFRGSDVKELSMVEAPKENQLPAMPNDPAIMGSTRPPGQQQQPPHQQAPNQQPPQFPGHQQPPYPPPPYGFPPGPPPPQFQQQARFQGPGGPHGFPGSPGAVPGYGGMGGFAPPPPGYGMPPYPPPGQGFPGPPPGAFNSNNQPMPIGPPGQQRPPHMQGPGQGPMGSGSKQGTPQPAPAQAAQPPNAQANAKPVEMSGTPVPSTATPSSAPPPPVESKPSTAAATAPPQAPAQQPQQKAAKKPTDSRIALPLAPNASTKPAAQRQAAAPSQASPAPGTQPSSYADATHAATAAVAAAMAKLGPAGQQQQQQQQSQQQQAGGNMDNLTQKVNQMRVQDAPIRGRGRGRGRGGPAGVRRESAHKPVEVPTEDYDFESANAKFNKQDLVKEQIASGEPLTSPQNGDIPDPISNGHTEIDEVVIPAKPGAEKGYDKQSSFFDNISSDLKDRQVTQGEMIDGRAMRRDERNKNVDTFGQGSVDNGYRGGFRGRGRGGRGFNRGGPRGGGGFAPRGNFEARGGAPRGRGRGGAGEATLA